ncbi:hypothetical protein AB0B40_19765 [Streptomyces sp. NPDC042638]|uniref:hypothetical protein n=1 Tax=Streptomyces sp. NPDC042638 TaxID=3154333 RepID=UPI0033E30501
MSGAGAPREGAASAAADAADAPCLVDSLAATPGSESRARLGCLIARSAVLDPER